MSISILPQAGPQICPKMVTLGLSMTLFPLPVGEMKDVIAEWGGKLFFDGAHQIGLIGGGQFQDPLREGADILTGSAGKTFSGPQSGIILWDDPALTQPVTTAVFPVWAATHQVNRVAALALATAEALAFGPAYMAQIVRNAQALARALEHAAFLCWGRPRASPAPTRPLPMWAVRTRPRRGAEARAGQYHRQQEPAAHDKPEDWDYPSGLRIGTIEVTRLGMKEPEMAILADFIAEVLVAGARPNRCCPGARLPCGYQRLYLASRTGCRPEALSDRTESSPPSSRRKQGSRGHICDTRRSPWIPAFAGMTSGVEAE
jgi:glycine hydroxymethyltransferase